MDVTDGGVVFTFRVPDYEYTYAMLDACLVGAPGDMYGVFVNNDDLHDVFVIGGESAVVRVDITGALDGLPLGEAAEVLLRHIGASGGSSGFGSVLDGCEPTMSITHFAGLSGVLPGKSMREQGGGPSPRIQSAVYPNPFNPKATIRLYLEASSRLVLEVYDMRGHSVATLAEGVFPVGEHEFEWDGRGMDGSKVPSGVYFYRATSGSQLITGKMALLK